MCYFTWAAARSQQLLFVVLAAGLWCLTAGCHVKSPLFPQPPPNRVCSTITMGESIHKKAYFPHVTWWFLWHWPISDVLARAGKLHTVTSGRGFVHGPPKRAVDKSKARSQNIKGWVLKTVVFTPSRINRALETVLKMQCPLRNCSMPAFFFLEREMARPVTISVSKLKKSSRWSLPSLKQHDLRL